MTGDGATTRSLPDPAVVARELLRHARDAFASPALGYAEPPEVIGGGQDTAIYGFRVAPAPEEAAGRLVLRLFPEQGGMVAEGARRARREAAVHNTLRAQGYPCPRIVDTGDAATIDGRHFVIMERVPGKMLFAQLIPPTRRAFQIGTRLAEAHARLHALNPVPLEQALAALPDQDVGGAEAALEWDDAELARRGATILRYAWRWLREHRPQQTTRAICHTDFHPLNLMVDGDHVTGVLDWSGAQIADPHFDVAATTILNLYGPAEIPRILARPFAAVRGALNGQYRRTYARLRSIDPERLAYYEALAIAERLFEVVDARAHGGHSAWSQPGLPGRLGHRFHEITGITVDVDAEVTWI